jgi:hypothetical protein
MNNNNNNNNNNNHILRSNTKAYDGKTNLTGSRNSDKTAPSDRESYHLQFLLQLASPETFGYEFVYCEESVVMTNVAITKAKRRSHLSNLLNFILFRCLTLQTGALNFGTHGF